MQKRLAITLLYFYLIALIIHILVQIVDTDVDYQIDRDYPTPWLEPKVKDTTKGFMLPDSLIMDYPPEEWDEEDILDELGY